MQTDDFLTVLNGFRQQAADNLGVHQGNLDAANATVAMETPAVAEWTDFLGVIDAEIAKFAPIPTP